MSNERIRFCAVACACRSDGAARTGRVSLHVAPRRHRDHARCKHQVQVSGQTNTEAVRTMAEQGARELGLVVEFVDEF
jgi:hypothetical protein